MSESQEQQQEEEEEEEEEVVVVAAAESSPAPDQAVETAEGEDKPVVEEGLPQQDEPKAADEADSTPAPERKRTPVAVPPERDPTSFAQTFSIVTPAAFGETVKQVDYIEARLTALEANNSDTEARVAALLNHKLGPYMAAMEAQMEGLVAAYKTGLQETQAQMAAELKLAQAMRERLNAIDADGLDKANQRVDEVFEALKRCEAADEIIKAGLEQVSLEASKANASVAVQAAEALQRARLELDGRLERQAGDIAGGAKAAAEAQASADACRALLDSLAQQKEADDAAQELADAQAKAKAGKELRKSVSLAARTDQQVASLQAEARTFGESIAGLQADVAVLGADAHHHHHGQGGGDAEARAEKLRNMRARFAEAHNQQQHNQQQQGESDGGGVAEANNNNNGEDNGKDDDEDHDDRPDGNAGGEIGGAAASGGAATSLEEEKEGGGLSAAPQSLVERVLFDAFGGMPHAPLVDPEVVAEHDKLLRAVVKKVNAQGRCLEGLVADAKWRLEQERLAREKNDGIAVQCLSCLRPVADTLPRLREALSFAGGDGGGAQRPRSAKARTPAGQSSAGVSHQELDDIFAALPQPSHTALPNGGGTGGPRPLSQGTPQGSANGVFLVGGPGMTQRVSLERGAGAGTAPEHLRTESPTNFDELLNEDNRVGGEDPANSESTDLLWEQMVKESEDRPGSAGNGGSNKKGKSKLSRAHENNRPQQESGGGSHQQPPPSNPPPPQLFPQRGQAVPGQRGLSGGSVRPSSANAKTRSKRNKSVGAGAEGNNNAATATAGGAQRPQSAGAGRSRKGKNTGVGDGQEGSGLVVTPKSQNAATVTSLSFAEVQWKNEEARFNEVQGGEPSPGGRGKLA